MSDLKKINDFIASIPDKRTANQIRSILDARFPTASDTGLTASTTQTQAGALPLKRTAAFHEVTTVATAANTIGLPPAKVGEFHWVKNSGANSMQVYGSGTDTIDSVATATGVEHLAGDAVMYVCLVDGNYIRLGGVQATEAFTSITTGAITGSDSSLGIAGQAAAQGGAVAIVGGTSSTAGNAGGASTMVGGTPGATGVGGAATITGGIGGATSGNGGAATLTGGAGTNGNAVGGAATVTAGAGQGTGAGAIASVVGGASGAGTTGNGGLASVTGGAATSTNGTGGAASIVGGLGTGTGAGGAVTITSGAAGATGVAGAVNISVGAATSGNGSAITVTGGAGAGGTNSGGNVNLVGGAAVSTGQPGEVQVNADSNLCFATYFFTGATSAAPTTIYDQVFFIATRALRVKSIKQVHSVAAGGTSTMTVIKDTGTSVPGGGTSLHQSGTFDLNATANTVQSATISSTIATANLAAGDRLSVKFANAIQSSVGIVVTVGMVPI